MYTALPKKKLKLKEVKAAVESISLCPRALFSNPPPPPPPHQYFFYVG